MISGRTIRIAIMAASLERNNAVTLPPMKRRTEKIRAVFRFTIPVVKGRSGRFTWSILKSIKSFKEKINSKNIDRIGKAFHIIVDGSDNFKTRFLINDYCFKKKKVLISGAISKFDGQVYTFNFLKKNSPCLKCFIPKMPPNPDIDNCEFDGVLGPLAGIIGSIQANEVVKEILGIGNTLCGFILIVDALKLTFRKVKLNKRLGCICYEK